MHVISISISFTNTCIFCSSIIVAEHVDTQEGERVMDTFQKQLHLPVTRIDDSKRMLSLLKVRESCLSSVCLLLPLGCLSVWSVCLSVCLLSSC